MIKLVKKLENNLLTNNLSIKKLAEMLINHGY